MKEIVIEMNYKDAVSLLRYLTLKGEIKMITALRIGAIHQLNLLYSVWGLL